MQHASVDVGVCVFGVVRCSSSSSSPARASTHPHPRATMFSSHQPSVQHLFCAVRCHVLTLLHVIQLVAGRGAARGGGERVQDGLRTRLRRLVVRGAPVHVEGAYGGATIDLSASIANNVTLRHDELEQREIQYDWYKLRLSEFMGVPINMDPINDQPGGICFR